MIEQHEWFDKFTRGVAEMLGIPAATTAGVWYLWRLIGRRMFVRCSAWIRGLLSLRAEVDRHEREIAKLAAAVIADRARWRAQVEEDERGYIQIDTSAHVCWCNLTYARMLGRSRDELMGLGAHSALDPESGGQVINSWRSAFAEHRRFEANVVYVRPDGKRVRTHTIGLPLKDEAGNTLGYLLEVEPLTVEG